MAVVQVAAHVGAESACSPQGVQVGALGSANQTSAMAGSDLLATAAAGMVDQEGYARSCGGRDAAS